MAVRSTVMSTQEDIIVVLSTVPVDKSAFLARMLVDKRVVACVNIIPVRSCYHWKGEFCDEEEHLLIAKTTKEKAREVIATIKSNHPYEVPEIIALPVIDGYLPYLEWVTQETLDEP
jgi:periplasmic divalent cation tolerance protein